MELLQGPRNLMRPTATTRVVRPTHSQPSCGNLQPRPIGLCRATGGRLALKRILDVALAGVLLVVLAPLLISVSIAIKLFDGSPTIFKQGRIGRNGQEFTMYKFRTMTLGTDTAIRSDPLSMQIFSTNDWKLPPDDPSITWIGAFMRRTSIDELPQLVNVLGGQMSLVGIRPVEPIQFHSWPDTNRAVYASMKPGLTGLWQVSGRSSITGENRLKLDSAYVANWSLFRDLQILLRTPRAVIQSGSSH